MNSMTGTFSQEILDQIKGQATAPLAGATAAVTTTGGAAPTTTPSNTKTSSRAPSSTKPASSTSTNAAVATKAGWYGIVIGAIVGASMF
jgi:cell division septation protein DedD